MKNPTKEEINDDTQCTICKEPLVVGGKNIDQKKGYICNTCALKTRIMADVKPLIDPYDRPMMEMIMNFEFEPDEP